MNAANSIFMENLYAVNPRVIRVQYQRVGIVNVNSGGLANATKHVQAGSGTTIFLQVDRALVRFPIQ